MKTTTQQLDFIMKLLSQRDHSEKELIQKLKKKFKDYPEDNQKALEYAKNHHWLKEPEELAQQVSVILSRRKKGTQYIQQYLKQKGLPTVKIDSETQLQNAIDLLEGRFKHLSNPKAMDNKEKAKRARFLSSRGFLPEIIWKALSSASFECLQNEDFDENN